MQFVMNLRSRYESLFVVGVIAYGFILLNIIYTAESNRQGCHSLLPQQLFSSGKSNLICELEENTKTEPLPFLLDHNGQLLSLNLSNENITPEQISSLVCNRSLRCLSMRHSNVDPKKLSEISCLTQLEYLDVGETIVNDAFVESISNLEDLHMLILRSTSITDNAVHALGKFNNLKVLDVSHTLLTEKGLLALQKIPHLRILCIDGIKVKQELGGYLQDFENLKFISVEGCGLTINEINDAALVNSDIQISPKEFNTREYRNVMHVGSPYVYQYLLKYHLCLKGGVHQIISRCITPHEESEDA